MQELDVQGCLHPRDAAAIVRTGTSCCRCTTLNARVCVCVFVCPALCAATSSAAC